MLRSMCGVLLASLIPLAGANALAVKAPPKPKAVPADTFQAGAWHYFVTQNPMDGPQETACTYSEETITQSPPYHNTRVKLCVGFKAGNVPIQDQRWTVLVSLLDDGQITDEKTVRIKEGDESPHLWHIVYKDEKNNYIGLDSPKTVVKSLLRHEKFIVELGLYGDGDQFATFDTAGLNVPPVGVDEMEYMVAVVRAEKAWSQAMSKNSDNWTACLDARPPQMSVDDRSDQCKRLNPDPDIKDFNKVELDKVFAQEGEAPFVEYDTATFLSPK